MNDKLLIIGGVAAGLAAAMQARRRSAELEITVLEKSRDSSYGACGLPYVISGLIPSLERLVIHQPDFFRLKQKIDLRLESEALEIMPAKSVVLTREKGLLREHGYTQLVMATGAAAICPPLPGHNLEGVFAMRHLNDGRRHLEYLERVRPRTAVVVGAGYIGLEMAQAFCERGLRTTVVEASGNVMSTLGGVLCARVAQEMKRHGVDVIFGEKAAAFEGSGVRVERVITGSGRVLEADIVSIGVGVKANAALAEGAGLEIGASGAVRTDDRQRTSIPNILAAGDCAEVLNLVSGRYVWFPLGQPAIKQGWTAGDNAAGLDTRYTGVVGTNVVKVFDLELGRTGLSIDEARACGFEAFSVESEAPSRAGYYPHGTLILTHLVFDRKGRLLGAQMVGQEGVAQRIDVYAAALHAKLTVDEIERFDLAYAPPYAPTIDPILRAAHKARQE